MDTRFTNEEMWGKKPFVTFLLLVIAISPAFLMLYSLNHYQLEDSNNPILLKVALFAYIVGLILCYLFRKKLFPYAHKAPVLEVLGIISLPAPFMMFVISIFLFLNAALDTQDSYTANCLVLYKNESRSLYVQLNSFHKSAIYVPKPLYEATHKGDKIRIKISPGFFNQPWIKE